METDLLTRLPRSSVAGLLAAGLAVGALGACTDDGAPGEAPEFEEEAPPFQDEAPPFEEEAPPMP